MEQEELKAYFEVCKKCEFFNKSKDEKNGKIEVKCQCEYLKEEESPIIGVFTKDNEGKETFSNIEGEEVPNSCTYYIEHFYLREVKKEEIIVNQKLNESNVQIEGTI